MADHLEEVQWSVRTASLTNQSSLGDVLPVSTSEITEVGVEVVLKKLRSDRAAGPDDIPTEHW